MTEKKPITIMLSKKEQELIEDALYVFEGRNYSICDGEGLFDGITAYKLNYGELKDKANEAISLRNRIEKIAKEKYKKPRAR